MSKLWKYPPPEEPQAAKQTPSGCLKVWILGGIALLWLSLSLGLYEPEPQPEKFDWNRVFEPDSPSEIEPPVQLAPSGDVREYADPRDRRWDNPSGREMIRAMAEDAGVSEEEMRKAVNDELDRRGLSDWADGR